ncbi:acetyl-CoA carboxylase family protein [Nocardia harenae]|uniref:acetyl-CoA carboxylase family protein n=1 Tax=Nocardia harenae TaxID=358707 RepID=UPI000830FA5B|nr:carboxyl transferase domain-containing protein [Nocardia harenae]
MRVVVANRGEVAVRILRTARDRGYETTVLHTAAERGGLAVRLADRAVELPGAGAAGYLDIAAVTSAAATAGPGALVHPGYGFLSENAEFAAACAAAGLTFVGPEPAALRTFGAKPAARAAAAAAGVPVLPATEAGADVDAVARFLAAQPGGVMIKAVAGGGGRGMRVVRAADEIAGAHARCAAEAAAGFGDGTLYAEALLPAVRHIEVQVAADGVRAVALGERDCSVQRNRQKLVELAPAVLPDALRAGLHADAVRVAAGCRGVLTVEFLVAGAQHYFLEVNPRLQVEHTVTEEVFGVDLVGVQFDLALGAKLDELELPERGRGFAVQARVNAERITAGGAVLPGAGVLGQFAPPTGAGVRVDTAAAPGQRVQTAFDPLLAKVIARGATRDAALRRCADALGETVVDGPDTNLALLRAVLARLAGAEPVDTGWFERNLTGLLADAAELAQREEPRAAVEPAAASGNGARGSAAHGEGRATRSSEADGGARTEAASSAGGAGAGGSAVGDSGAGGSAASDAGAAGSAVGDAGAGGSAGGDAGVGDTTGRGRAGGAPVPAPDTPTLRSPMAGSIVSLPAPGTLVPPGAELAVLEAMKMQHVLRAETALRVTAVLAAPGAVVDPGAPLLTWTPEAAPDHHAETTELDLDEIRPDLAEVIARQHRTTDAARPAAVAKRRGSNRRTARENIADLVDPDSFVEYGALAVAAQRLRRSADDLIANTPADGLIAGLATVNARRYGPERTAAVVLSYDYTVLAGTQGMRSHAKTDRMLHLAAERNLPVVFFTEGGGGRPGDTDYGGISGLDVTTFHAMGALSGRVPLIGIVSGRCFAGNAALLGMCDVVIATPDATIGMGGPAMIEGGGLGVVTPEEVGPVEVQRRNGVVHLVAADEADAVRLARRYLAYFQGSDADWEAPDPRLARHVVPQNRLRAFDIRAALDSVADIGSVLELRRDWAPGVLTALARFDGVPFGVIANDCTHLGGAIDAPEADKLSMFLRLCQAHRLPIVSLCDTPGFMVGPEAEKQATVTRFSRLFVDAAALTVPFGTVIVRKGYGLGAQAMAAGSFRAPRFVIAWPTGEIGGMGLEGAVRLGFAKELAALDDPEQRREAYENLVAAAYEQGKALSAATVLELDDVIDPADTRRWIRTLR